MCSDVVRVTLKSCEMYGVSPNRNPGTRDKLMEALISKVSSGCLVSFALKGPLSPWRKTAVWVSWWTAQDSKDALEARLRSVLCNGGDIDNVMFCDVLNFLDCAVSSLEQGREGLMGLKDWAYQHEEASRFLKARHRKICSSLVSALATVIGDAWAPSIAGSWVEFLEVAFAELTEFEPQGRKPCIESLPALEKARSSQTLYASIGDAFLKTPSKLRICSEGVPISNYRKAKDSRVRSAGNGHYSLESSAFGVPDNDNVESTTTLPPFRFNRYQNREKPFAPLTEEFLNLHLQRTQEACDVYVEAD